MDGMTNGEADTRAEVSCMALLPFPARSFSLTLQRPPDVPSQGLSSAGTLVCLCEAGLKCVSYDDC